MPWKTYCKAKGYLPTKLGLIYALDDAGKLPFVSSIYSEKIKHWTNQTIPAILECANLGGN